MTGNVIDFAVAVIMAGAFGAVIAYGSWVNTIINLIIVGFVMFIIVKAYNKTKTPVEEAPPAGPSDNGLLAEIRDLLKK